MTFKKSVSDFAQKLESVPKEIRAMSGVPSAVRKEDSSGASKPDAVQTAQPHHPDDAPLV